MVHPDDRAEMAQAASAAGIATLGDEMRNRQFRVIWPDGSVRWLATRSQPIKDPSGRVLRVRGRGVETAKGTGDLLATVQVVVPQRLSDAARTALEALAADEAGVDPRADLMAHAAE